MESSDWLIKEHEIKQESDQFAGRHFASHHRVAAKPQYQDHAKCRKKTHGWIVIGPRAHNTEVSPPQILRSPGKAFVFMSLPTVSFDLTDTLQVIHEDCIQCA